MKSKVCHYKELILHEFNSSSGTLVTPQGFLVKESVGTTVVPEEELWLVNLNVRFSNHELHTQLMIVMLIVCFFNNSILWRMLGTKAGQLLTSWVPTARAIIEQWFSAIQPYTAYSDNCSQTSLCIAILDSITWFDSCRSASEMEWLRYSASISEEDRPMIESNLNNLKPFYNCRTFSYIS